MNVYRVAEMLKLPERNIIDMSSPFNPLGPSKKVKAELRKYLKALKNRPDPECKRLRSHLSRHLRIDPDMIICFHDKLELMRSITRIINPRRALVMRPSEIDWSGYLMKELGIDNDDFITDVDLGDGSAFFLSADEFIGSMEQCDMAILSNPSFPAGFLIKREDMLKIARHAKDKQCHLVVDEAYIDFVKDTSIVEEARDNPYLIILHNMGPYHSLSGLMIHYLVASRYLINDLVLKYDVQPPNLLAQRAAVVALKDRTFRKETDLLLATEKDYLEGELRKLGLSYHASKTHYFLVKVGDAARLLEFLLKRRIFLKKFGDGLVLISVKTHRENAVFIRAIKEYIQRKGQN